MRATDLERERAVGKLRGAYLRGALSTDTFETRAAVAYRSQTDAELAGVVYDLPTLWDRARRLMNELAARLFEEPPASATAHARVIELPRRSGERVFVGRHERCEVVVDDPTVSRWHAEISCEGGGWQVRDLASTNGTFIWDRRISAAQARPEDVLYLGGAALRLVEPPRE